MQRAAGSSEPSNERVKLTKTGRISKAKKGMRVHDCETCGKRYTRAEHLRRHQLNHSTGSLRCDVVGCNKTFHREDLLLRHRERHLETQIGQSSRDSPRSQSSPEASGPIRYGPLSVPGASGSPSNVAVSTPSTYPSTVESTSAYVPSSSGYASPNYGNITLPFAGQPHAQLLERQRSFSNTSLIEQYLPQQVATTKSQLSPAPSIIGPYWTEWHTEQPGREHNVYATSSTNESRSASISRTPTLASYPFQFPNLDWSAFAAFTYLQRDMSEGAELSLQQEDDMATAQYLNLYWELSHSQYPILHRPSFVLSSAPPILKAAILAIGSRFSLDWNAKQYSRKLHEQCLKVLAKRASDGYESKRLYDMQAVFLVELYMQYMNRRTPPGLSTRFKDLYHTLCFDDTLVSSMPLEYILGVQSQPDEVSLPDEWMQHCELLKFLQKRRLLTLCYLLDSQKRSLFPQSLEHEQVSGLNLPFLPSSECWDGSTAEDVAQWRQESAEFSYVSEILNGTVAPSSHTIEPFDPVRSALLIAVAKETDPRLLDPSRLAPQPSTQLLYLATLLAHCTPLRALLAIAGESWVMGEKLPSLAEYESLRASLRLWATADESGHGTISNNTTTSLSQNSATALTTALRILRLELNRPPAEARAATLVEQWAVYLAALVLWARMYAVVHALPPGQGQQQQGEKGFGHGTPSMGSETAQIPVHTTLAKVEAGRWEDVVKGRGVVGVLTWVRGKINGSSNGLVVEAVLVLGKLVERGSEEEWF
ncbi:MAG: hypothetical protein Q9165_006364 [Trypethelium subeluteriae]